MLEYQKVHKKFVSINLRYIYFTSGDYFIYHSYNDDRKEIIYRRGYYKKDGTWVFCGISLTKYVGI